MTNSEHGVTESASKVAVTMVEFHSCPRQEEDTTKILGANSYTSGKYRHIWQIIKKKKYIYTQGRENELETHKT